MPIVKMTGVGKVQKGRAKLTEVSGERVDGSGDWKGSFYSSDTRLANEIAEFGQGDFINVKMEKNQKGFWDVQSFTEADPELVKSIAGKGTGKPKNYGGGKSSSYSGGKKWDGRTGAAYDRSASVYLAFDMIKASTSDAAMKKKTTDDLVDETFALAEHVNKYIHDGDLGVPEDLNSSGDDPLTPPEIVF